MKSTCIAHPAQEPLIVIRQWQLEFCEGDSVAAALMSYFEYWHNIKLEMSASNKKLNDIAERHGEERNQSEHLFQFHKEEELCKGIMKIGKEDKVRQARNFLRDKGIITEHKNPNPRYKFDNTVHYLFHPEVAMAWLDSEYRKIGGRELENPSRRLENRGTIPKTTTEIKKEDIYISSKESEDFLLREEKETERPEPKSILESLSSPLSPLSPNSASPPSPSVTEAFQQLAEAFVENKLCFKCPKLTPSRREKLATRLKTWSFDEILQAFKGYISDKWWRGDGGKGWKMNMDYLLRTDEIIETGIEKLQQQSAPAEGPRYVTDDWLAANC